MIKVYTANCPDENNCPGIEYLDSNSFFKTRFNSKYQDIGKEPVDNIFLNKEFWPKLKIHTYEDFIEYICKIPKI